MHALVYTDTQTLVYREEKNPTEKPGESILKIQACIFKILSPGFSVGFFSSL